jgi:hypothetical protein
MRAQRVARVNDRGRRIDTSDELLCQPQQSSESTRYSQGPSAAQSANVFMKFRAEIGPGITGRAVAAGTARRHSRSRFIARQRPNAQLIALAVTARLEQTNCGAICVLRAGIIGRKGILAHLRFHLNTHNTVNISWCQHCDNNQFRVQKNRFRSTGMIHSNECTAYRHHTHVQNPRMSLDSTETSGNGLKFGKIDRIMIVGATCCGLCGNARDCAKCKPFTQGAQLNAE